MSLDLHVHTEVNVGIFLPRGHRGVLHWVQIDAVQVCRQTNRKQNHFIQLQRAPSPQIFFFKVTFLIRQWERRGTTTAAVEVFATSTHTTQLLTVYKGMGLLPLTLIVM